LRFTVTKELYGEDIDNYTSTGLPILSPHINANATLANLERALERATAIIMWSAAQAGTVTMYPWVWNDQAGFVDAIAVGGQKNLATQMGQTVMVKQFSRPSLKVRGNALMVSKQL